MIAFSSRQQEETSHTAGEINSDKQSLAFIFYFSWTSFIGGLQVLHPHVLRRSIGSVGLAALLRRLTGTAWLRECWRRNGI